MDIYTATEQAYKNGYDAGIKSQQAEIERLKKDIQESDILIDMQDKALREQTELIEELKEEKDRLRYNLKMVCKEQDEDNIRADAIKEFENLVARRLNCNTPRGAYLINLMNEVKKEMRDDI